MFKGLFVLFMLLLMLSSVFSLQIEDLSQELNTNSQELAGVRAEIKAEMEILHNEIAALPTGDATQAQLQAHLNLTNELLANFKSILLIYQIIIQVLVAAGMFGMYFFLKQKGRV